MDDGHDRMVTRSTAKRRKHGETTISPNTVTKRDHLSNIADTSKNDDAKSSQPSYADEPARGDNREVIQPLFNHPELEIRRYGLNENGSASLSTFRVYNYRTLGNGRIVRGDGWTLMDLLIIFGLVFWLFELDWGDVQTRWRSLDFIQWVKEESSSLNLLSIALLVLFIIHKSRTTLYQTVTPLPGLGIQLSTTRGFSFPFITKRLILPLSTSNRFIPLSRISTVVINEGLSRWSVRYYLAIIKRRGEGVVALDEVRPRHQVLREIYHGVREILFDEWAESKQQ